MPRTRIVEDGPAWWQLAAVAAVLLAIAYANGLDGAFVFDDEPSVVSNLSIRRLWPLGPVLFTSGDTGRTHDGRPLVNLSFAVSYALHGTWRPGLRLGNLAIHLANVCLVYVVTRRLLGRGAGPRWLESDLSQQRWLAAAVALLWAVHPLHTHVVTYIVQRAESLGACFILGSFLAATVALDAGSLTAVAVAVILGIAGGFTKETTVSILPLVAAYDWAYRPTFAIAGDPRTGRVVRGLLYSGLLLNPLAIMSAAALTGGRGHSAGFGTAPIIDYLLTQCMAVWLYIGRVCWPATLVLEHGDRLATFAEAWPSMLAMLVLLSLIAVGYWRRPAAFFPAVAAVLLLAPSSSVVPIATQTVAEHRAYLASAVIVGYAVMGAATFLRHLGNRRTGERWLRYPLTMACVVAVIATGWIGRTMLRNRDFRTAETLWRQNVRDCPGNPRGLRNLAELFTLEQRYDGAERVYREALAIPQLQTYAACGLGDALRRQGRFKEAREAYQLCISSDAEASAAQFRALAGLAAAEVGLGFPDRAIALINEMSSPVWHGVRMAAADRWQAMGRGMVFKAAAHRRLGDAATADEELRRAVAFAVEKPSAAETIARSCDDMRQFATAAILWEPIAARDPSVLANLAVSRIEAGQIDGAIEAFEQAVAAYPDEPGMRANLERAREIARRQADKTPASDSR